MLAGRTVVTEHGHYPGTYPIETTRLVGTGPEKTLELVECLHIVCAVVGLSCLDCCQYVSKRAGFRFPVWPRETPEASWRENLLL